MKTTLILVRHGKTEWNKKGLIQGQTDIPLSVEGVEEARALAKTIPNFNITRVVTSTLKRAIHTAEIIAEKLNIPHEQCKGLNERGYGQFEGKPWREADKHLGTPTKPVVNTSHLDAESYTKFKKRILKTLNTIIAKHRGETILIVCHGGVLHALARHFHNIADTQESFFNFPNTSVSIFHVDGKNITVEIVGKTPHLN